MISAGIERDPRVSSMIKKMNYRPGQGLGKNEQENPKLPDFNGQGNTKGLGYKGVGLSKIERKRFFNRNNLLRNMGPLKDSFVKEGKGKFYLGEKEPVKVVGINILGFEIFKEQIVESLVWNNKEIVMQKVAEKIGTEAVKELLCLPPNEEPPQDLASIISDSFCDVFYEENDVITSGLFEDENSVFILVNDMILMLLCILILIIHACLTLILFN